MIYHGNFKDWIKPEWTDYWTNNTGLLRPEQGETPKEQYKNALHAGLPTGVTMWEYFSFKNCPFNITEFPLDNHRNIVWWVTKMKPGMYCPLHTDDYNNDRKNCTRYWMPLQDYTTGHIFLYKDEFVKDYKMGDIWSFDSATEIHGAANIGYIPRMTFLFTSYDL